MLLISMGLRVCFRPAASVCLLKKNLFRCDGEDGQRCCLHSCHRRGDKSQRGFCWDWGKSLNTDNREEDSEGQPFAIFTTWTVDAMSGNSCGKFSARNASGPVANGNNLTVTDKTVYVKTEDSLSSCTQNHSTVFCGAGKCTGKWKKIVEQGN